ncbi:alpha/beta fold hydrolase [Marinobacterium mangrovicola]|uniref:Haloacetate dehalogenase n=1 Tax=Marinobacterium mangrovicola TaxID=1476959 RepID=A0A4R1GV59_9GAMM|nr:alpha/beta hydrolase [Marinobacterium mangrovicola]TCK08202.1 haloacetate dehalogenase [Marinobacterium mangrovicola]
MLEERMSAPLFDSRFTCAEVSRGDVSINLVHGGSGPPLLLIHGYPQTHVIWHRIAPLLADHFHLICPDLRGYGDSAKPAGLPDHSNYSKREMAADMIAVMDHFGYQRFAVGGHDRGARVTHRLALDYPERVERACVMDIAPTLHMFDHTDQAFATGYYHWFFLIQPDGLPEHLIGQDPDYYLNEKLKRWAAPGADFAPAARAEYLRCFRNPKAIHGSCEDYRAAAGIDLEHDRADRGRSVDCPLLVLWGARGFVHRTYDLLSVWRNYARDVSGYPLECGHFLPEEQPDELAAALKTFCQVENNAKQ